MCYNYQKELHDGVPYLESNSAMTVHVQNDPLVHTGHVMRGVNTPLDGNLSHNTPGTGCRGLGAEEIPFYLIPLAEGDEQYSRHVCHEYLCHFLPVEVPEEVSLYCGKV